MIEQHLPVLVIAIPLIAAPLMILIGNRHVVAFLSLVVAWIVFAISIALLGRVLAEGAFEYQLGGWPSPYGIVYRIDHFNAFVMLFVSALGALVLTYAPQSIAVEIPKSKHYLFYPSYLLCLTGLLGMCVTGDLFNVFVFLEISSLSSYALICLGKTRRAPLASFQYLILGTIGATFFLLGIGLLYQITGTLNMADIAAKLTEATGDSKKAELVAFAFMTVGLFIKMAVFPLHTWLPNAYTYAPSVVTTFIAATSTKVSVYAFARLVYTIYTPAFAFELLPLDHAMMVLSLIGIFVASTAAIYQTNVKRLLAYSSVAQIGYMLLGIGLATEAGVAAGVVHMFNHAFIKGGLFMVVGCFALRIGSVRLQDLSGAATTMPWTCFAWAVGGLGLIGVPLTAGFVSKWMLLTATMNAGNLTVAMLMLISSLLAVVYVWKVVEAIYFGEPSEKVKAAKEAPLSMLIPTYVVIGATLVFGCWTKYSAEIAQLAAKALLDASEVIQ